MTLSECLNLQVRWLRCMLAESQDKFHFDGCHETSSHVSPRVGIVVICSEIAGLHM